MLPAPDGPVIHPTAAEPTRSSSSHNRPRSARRGLVDATLAAVLFQGGSRRSEAAALTWQDVAEATTDDGPLLTIHSKRVTVCFALSNVRNLGKSESSG